MDFERRFAVSLCCCNVYYVRRSLSKATLASLRATSHGAGPFAGTLLLPIEIHSPCTTYAACHACLCCMTLQRTLIGLLVLLPGFQLLLNRLGHVCALGAGGPRPRTHAKQWLCVTQRKMLGACMTHKSNHLTYRPRSIYALPQFRRSELARMSCLEVNCRHPETSNADLWHISLQICRQPLCHTRGWAPLLRWCAFTAGLWHLHRHVVSAWPALYFFLVLSYALHRGFAPLDAPLVILHS